MSNQSEAASFTGLLTDRMTATITLDPTLTGSPTGTLVACADGRLTFEGDLAPDAAAEMLIRVLAAQWGAQASVIAAAPELLAALREAREMLRSCGIDEVDPEPELVASWERGLAKIDAALETATGATNSNK